MRNGRGRDENDDENNEDLYLDLTQNSQKKD